MVTRTIEKQLAGIEDLLTGEGTAQQTRAGSATTISKIDIIWPVDTLAALKLTDPVAFPKVHMLGNVSKGDSLAADYYWLEDDVSVADDIDVIASSVRVTGRWLRLEAAVKNSNGVMESIEDVINAKTTVFENTATLVAAAVTAGSLVSTKGYTTAGDGGGAPYLIKTAVEYGGAPDGYGDLLLVNGNVAVLQDDGSATAKQFGAKADGTTDDTLAINAYLAYKKQFGGADFPSGEFAAGGITYNMQNIQGDGKTTKFVPSAGSSVMMVGSESPANRWIFNKISDLMFEDADLSQDVDGFTFSGANFTGKTTFDHVDFNGLNAGIVKQKGNIGNHYNRCSFGYSNFGIVARDDTSGGLMHAGGDLVTSGHFQRTDLAAIYINDSTDGAGMFTIDNAIIEANYGYGLLVNGFAQTVPVPPIWLKQVWFEGNATSPSVTVDGYTAAPTDMCFRNAKAVFIDGTYVKDIRLENTTAVMNGCRSDSDTGSINLEVDSNSAMVVFNHMAATTGFDKFIQNYSHMDAWTGSDVSPCKMAHRCVKTAIGYGYNISEAFESGGTYAWSGTTSRSSVNAVDGLLFDNCTEMTMNAGETMLGPVAARGTIETGKWNVVTLGYKQTVGVISDLEINVWNGAADRIRFTSERKLNQWITGVALVDCVDRVTAAAMGIYLRGFNTTTQVRFCDFQIMSFDTKQDALDYIDSREYQVTP